MQMSEISKRIHLLLFLSLVVFAGTARAEMPVTFLDIDPEGAAYYGWGYNTTTRQVTAPCLNVNSSATYATGEVEENSFFNFTENTATIAAESNLNVRAALKVLVGAAASNKTSVVGGSQSSTYNQTLLASAYRYKIPKYLDLGEVSFKPSVLQALTTPGGKGQFSQQCGDAFVIGIQTGREFVGTAMVSRQDLKSWTRFANETDASASGLWGSAKLDVDLGKSMEQAFGSQNITVSTYSTGSNLLKPTKASELKNYYQRFLNSNGEEKTVRLTVAPYTVVDGYPWESPLAGNTREDYIGMMVVALWGLRAAVNDANFVLAPQTATMFALGLNSTVKTQRTSYIKQQRDAWQREYDMLLAAAQKCDSEFTDQCRDLAEFYDRNRNLASQWQAVLPERYLSDCYQQRGLNDFSALKNDLMTRNFGTPFKGDAETSGVRSRVVAELTLHKDQRQLKADLSVAKIEWKRKDWRKMPVEARSNKGESGWGLHAQAVIFDLDQPERYGLGQENLKHCSFVGEGVKATAIQTPTAADYTTRFGFGQRTTHGYIDGVTGKNPRGQQHFGAGEGVLDFITCEVDRGGNDNNMQCLDLGVRNVRLSLYSTQDLAADHWQKPAPPAVPTVLSNFRQNKPVALAQNVNQFAVFTQLVPAGRKQLVVAAEKQKTAASAKFRITRFALPAQQQGIARKRLDTNSLKLKRP